MPEHYIELKKLKAHQRKEKFKAVVSKIARQTKKGAVAAGKGAIVVGKQIGKGAKFAAQDIRKGAAALEKAGKKHRKKIPSSAGPLGSMDLFGNQPQKKKKKGKDDFDIFGGL